MQRLIYTGNDGPLLNGETVVARGDPPDGDDRVLVTSDIDGQLYWVSTSALTPHAGQAPSRSKLATLLDLELMDFLEEHGAPRSSWGTMGNRLRLVHQVAMRSGPPQTIVDRFNGAAKRWRQATRLLLIASRLTGHQSLRERP